MMRIASSLQKSFPSGRLVQRLLLHLSQDLGTDYARASRWLHRTKLRRRVNPSRLVSPRSWPEFPRPPLRISSPGLRLPHAGRPSRRSMKKPTRVNHPPAVTLPADNHAVVSPIYQSVKFEFDTVEETERYLRGERPGFYYSRSSNPTMRQLELLLAELQGREDCLVTASGVGAISQTLLALTNQGDHIIAFIESYNPTRYLIRRVLGRFGVAHTLLSIEDLAGVERALAARPTRLIIFESPTNPVTKVADIAALTRL